MLEKLDSFIPSWNPWDTVETAKKILEKNEDVLSGIGTTMALVAVGFFATKLIFSKSPLKSKSIKILLPTLLVSSLVSSLQSSCSNFCVKAPRLNHRKASCIDEYSALYDGSSPGALTLKIS